MSKDNERTKRWTFIVYAEHFPEFKLKYKKNRVKLQKHILELISTKLLGKGYISPLHFGKEKDFDSNSDFFDTIKPHYHVNLEVASVITVKQLADMVGSALPPNSFIIDTREWDVNKSRVRNWVSACRYLIHLDQPEKQQFNCDRSLVMSFGGADYIKDSMTKDDIVESITDIKKYIYENAIMSWYQFDNYIINERPDWNKLICLYRPVKDSAWDSIKAVRYEKTK